MLPRAGCCLRGGEGSLGGGSPSSCRFSGNCKPDRLRSALRPYVRCIQLVLRKPAGWRCSCRSLLPNSHHWHVITTRTTCVPRLAATPVPALAMQSLQARIDSFQKTKRVRRYPNKASPSVSVKWPYPPDFEANANTLAEAGFFFSPSWDERDAVTCFLCGKELSDWDENDNPFEIHYTKCQSSCAWAVVRCGLAEDLDSEGRCGKSIAHVPYTYPRL